MTNALRRLVLHRVLTDGEGLAALEGFLDLALIRYPAHWLRPRMWELRHNVSAYDATYIALAEQTGATLLTTDNRLLTAPGIRCEVRAALT